MSDILFDWDYDPELFPKIGKAIYEDLHYFEKRGFFFLNRCRDFTSSSPERVAMPSGRILDSQEIDRELKKLEFGNRRQIECLTALEYCRLINHIPGDIKLRYPSFVSEADKFACKSKYPLRL